MRPIDADKIILDYSGLAKIAPNDFVGIAKYFVDQIKAAPTITPESLVRHGRWRWCGEDRWNDAYECSECGKIHTDDSDYCPNCGTKMDLEE